MSFRKREDPEVETTTKGMNNHEPVRSQTPPFDPSLYTPTLSLSFFFLSHVYPSFPKEN